ncbi:MAG: hypothetical protein ACTINL_03785 [Serratia proteamaculans]
MIKRFNPDFSLSISHELAYMRETPEGGYVAHGDYATLFSELELVKADRDAQQKRADALAVENAGLKEFIKQKCFVVPAGASCLAEADEPAAESIPETPATSAALAAIEARGVEKFIVWSTASSGFDYDLTIEDAQKFATELREAK